MKLSDIKLMHSTIDYMTYQFDTHLDTLESGEWSNFYDVYHPLMVRFEWILNTLEEELREWD